MLGLICDTTKSIVGAIGTEEMKTYLTKNRFSGLETVLWTTNVEYVKSHLLEAEVVKETYIETS